MPLQITVEDLAAGRVDRLLGDYDPEAREIVTLVSVDHPVSTETLHRAAVRAMSTDRILIGVARRMLPMSSDVDILLEEFATTFAVNGGGNDSVVFTDEVDARAIGLAEAVARNPHSSTIFLDTLRATASLDVPDALQVESLAYSALLGGGEFREWLAGREAPSSPPMVADPVLARRKGDTLHITLNRPQRRNAYGAQLRNELVRALTIAEADESIELVIVDGAGTSFCAGGDLAEFGLAANHSEAHLIRTRGGAGRLVDALRDRIRFEIHGPCVGAGVEIPALAGRLVADPHTTFLLPEVSMGLIPGAGGTVSLPRRIGRWRSFALCVTAQHIDAEQALSWGLVDEVRPREAAIEL
ncbi:enoyl-CoA hydratase/isomerase family protein [Leucobacter denitrificans]|uniref:enoyl-CoA hydratase/isomerase family protein n=1 Tax=Leucobacter denitrificans TaxID=683042 RepID=UPI001CB7562A|nr:enoyl-CoA hydratase/isomerase family protein [Leucobacter denitrificans]